MTDQDATLQDVWRLLGTMNRRINERLDAVERQIVATDAKVGALKESIEARDFRLDEHGRRLSKLEESQP